MKAREEILTRLRSRERDMTPPPAWRSRRRFADLAEQFMEALSAAKGEPRRAGNLEEALAQVEEVLCEIGARTAVANTEPPLDAIDLPGRWPACDGQAITWGVADSVPADSAAEARSAWRDFCASADIGLTGADAALAETGTIVVSSGPGRSRLTSLLPPVHLALVPTTRLTSDIFTWVDGRDNALPTAMTLVSGPSKTADIEQTMAIGVHGPKRFIVILYD
jgi:L-lactate dehydrogenase complex protein LldG